LGQRRYGKSESQKDESEPDAASPSVYGAREIWQQSFRHEFAQAQLRSSFGANKKHNKKRNHEQSPEPLWCAESHR
jgi:hypothetical protein